MCKVCLVVTEKRQQPLLLKMSAHAKSLIVEVNQNEGINQTSREGVVQVNQNGLCQTHSDKVNQNGLNQRRGELSLISDYGSPWSRYVLGCNTADALPPDARANHNHDLAEHGICPLCFKVNKSWKGGVCRVCTPRLVTLRSPSEAKSCGLTPFLNNLFLWEEVCTLAHPPPLYKGESHVARHVELVPFVGDDVDE